MATSPYQQQIGTFGGWYWQQTTAAVGSFATGYEQVPQPKRYSCPKHGLVSVAHMIPMRGGGYFHAGCGKVVEKLTLEYRGKVVEVRNESGPLTI